MNTEPVEIIPTYASMVDPFIAVLQNENASYESLNTAREFFMDCAKTADRYTTDREVEIEDYELATTKLSDLPPFEGTGYFGDFVAIIEPNEDRPGNNCYVMQNNEMSSLAVVQNFGVIETSGSIGADGNINVPQKIINRITEWAEDNGY